MAFKNIFKLSTRRQGELVGQIFKYIYLYNDFFVPRARVYLKELAQLPDTIYWLENPKTNEVSSIAIVDPKYHIELSGLKFITLGHTISKIPNQIHNILDHILGDYKESNIILLSRELFANAMQITENYGFTCLTPADIKKFWPEFANLDTDYFNLTTKEEFLSGCIRKGYNIYIKIQEADLKTLKKNSLPLYKFILNESILS
jgi:hypothetical protein